MPIDNEPKSARKGPNSETGDAQRETPKSLLQASTHWLTMKETIQILFLEQNYLKIKAN